MSEPLLSDVQIELHVPDFEVAKKFYTEIGYEIVWERPPGQRGYLVLRNGRSILNFYNGSSSVSNHEYFRKFSKDTPKGYGVEIIIPRDDIDELYRYFQKERHDSIVEILNQEHSHRDFRVVDPFGFYLRFVERYNWVDGRKEDGTQIETT